MGGQGAKNGALAFLGIPQRQGSTATEYYHKALHSKTAEIERYIGIHFPKLPARDRRVTLGDIEPVLCAAFVYAGLVKKLRKQLGKRSIANENVAWECVEKLGAPAGFYAYDRNCQKEDKPGDIHVPKLP